MAGVGLVFTVSFLESFPVQPLELVTVQVYVAAMLTTIVCVVAPVLQL